MKWPMKQYGVVLADPPWRFTTWSEKGKGRAPEQHYSTMSVGELRNLPVQSTAADDCVLFLWVVDSHLQWSFDLMKSWGFTYKTIGFNWVKPSIGLGYWTRKRSEVCLLATRGKPKRLDRGVDQVIEAKRRAHSAKPMETHARIERLVAGPYLELFARERREGWDAWGDDDALS